MGFRVALAHAGLRGTTARAVRAESKVPGGRSLADSRGRANRRVPAACVSAREGLAARRRASVVPAASKTTLDAVTYAFAEDGSAAVLDAPVGESEDSTVTSSGASDTETLAASAGASPAPPASPASPAPDLERLTFEPSRVEDLKEASSAAAAATAGPAQGQTDESAMAAFTSDDMLCMLYGVDQDKEDSKYKVAFFDLDAVVAAGALRDAAAAVRAHVASGAAGAFEPGAASESDSRLEAFSAKTTAPPKTAALPGWVPAWLRRPLAALVAFLAQTVFAQHRIVSLWSDGADQESADQEASSAADASLTFSSRALFAGARADAASTAALARKIYDAHLHAGVFPEAVRFAKQLRYDGYKIVLVTSAPAFAAEPVAAQLGASRVLGETLEIDAATGAFADTSKETSGLEGLEEDFAYDAGERKSASVAAFAEEVGVNLNQSIAYGRLGKSGLALMERVGKAYAVSPDDALRLEAEKRGWQTLSWAEDARRRAEVAAARDVPTGDVGAHVAAAPALAFAGAGGVPKNAASAAWTMRDPDQYDPENDRRSR